MSKKIIFVCIVILFIPYLTFAKKKERGVSITDSTLVVINKIFIGGNKKTKERIISRELIFQVGDTIYNEQIDYYIDKSKENLLNTSLFNYITINSIREHNNAINLYVLVEERWYLWPYLILEHADRNFSSFLHNKDWSRINYGLMLIKNNFRGRGETLKFKFRLGYKEQFQLAYEIPYLGKNRRHGLSTEINWFRQNEISYLTNNDQLVYFKDPNEFVSKMYNSRLTYTFRKKHYISHNFTTSYSFHQVTDTIVVLNKNFFSNTTNKTQYIALNYSFVIDKRNYKFYPLTGYNFELSVSQNGINILANEMKGIWELETLGYYYLDLNNRWYSGLGAQAKISSNRKQPYFIEQALGYASFLRAFEYNVIDGQHFATARTFMKYALIPQKIKHIETWNWSKFNKIHYSLYINAFIDIGYVSDIKPYYTNELPNTLLASAGIGIDIAAYYDQILRFEYSINRFSQHGFFVHIGKAF